MAATNLTVTLLMGLFLIGVVGLMRAIRKWRRKTPAEATSGGLVERAIRSPTVWTAVFALLALGFTGGAILFASGGELGIDTAGVGIALAGAAAAVLILYVFFGIYSSVRSRGLGTAQAVGAGSVVLGLLLLVVITAKLVAGV